MKILYACHAINYHIKTWVPAMIKAGLEIEIVTFNPDISLDVTQHHLKPNFDQRIIHLDYFLARDAFKTIAQLVQPDLVLASFATTYGWLAQSFREVPLIIQTWSRDIGAEASLTQRERFIITTLGKQLLLSSDGITTDGPHFLKHLHETLPSFPKDRTLSTWWGIDTDFFSPECSTFNSLFKKWNIDPSYTVLLSHRGVFWYYQPLIVLQSIYQALEENSSLYAIVLTLEHDRTSEVQALLDKLSQHERAQVIDRFLKPDEMKEIWSLTTSFISTPKFDGIAESVQEGMCMNALPIVNPLEANTLILDDINYPYFTRSIFPSPEELNSLIHRTTQKHSQEHSFWLDRNRKHIIHNHSLKKTAASLKSFLEGITKRKKD